MKAVRCHRYGPPESLVLEDVADPVPGPGQAVIDVHACGINFPDVLMVAGQYQSQPPFPFSPGGECAGTVAAIGPGVTHLEVGQRVVGGAGHGGFAEKLVIDAKRLRPAPDTMDMVTASAFSTTYGTSYYALKQRGRLKPGETLLVLGAGGGVGLAAVELGKAMGARVIAAASSREKLDAARECGADELIDYSSGELKEQVKALTAGLGADVIYDPVGGPLFDQCMRCVNWGGRVLVIGFVAGIPKLPTNLVLLKGCEVVGVFYGSFTAREPEAYEQNVRELIALHAEGAVKPLIGKVFPMAEYAAALNCLKSREAIGKIVLKIRD